MGNTRSKICAELNNSEMKPSGKYVFLLFCVCSYTECGECKSDGDENIKGREGKGKVSKVFHWVYLYEPGDVREFV